MKFRSRSDFTTRWVVLLLWCVATLAPTLAQAASAWRTQAQPWAELCMTATPAAGERHGDANGQATHEHCAACMPRLDPMAPAPAMPAVQAVLLVQRLVPTLYLQAATPLFAWTRAQPRAPPTAA